MEKGLSIVDSIEDESLGNQLKAEASSPWEIHILQSSIVLMNLFQSETMNSFAKLFSGLKPPSIFKTPKEV